VRQLASIDQREDVAWVSDHGVISSIKLRQPLKRKEHSTNKLFQMNSKIWMSLSIMFV
jgi:hypothetical protein